MGDQQRDQQQGTQRPGAGGQQQGNPGHGGQRPEQSQDQITSADRHRAEVRQQEEQDRGRENRDDHTGRPPNARE